jgi:hypothetical protein
MQSTYWEPCLASDPQQTPPAFATITSNCCFALNAWFALQEQRRVTLVTLAAVVVFVVVGTINLTGAVNKQQLW